MSRQRAVPPAHETSRTPFQRKFLQLKDTHDVSYRDLAAALTRIVGRSVWHSEIQHWATGKYRPDEDEYLAMGKYFGVTPESLMDDASPIRYAGVEPPAPAAPPAPPSPVDTTPAAGGAAAVVGTVNVDTPAQVPGINPLLLDLVREIVAEHGEMEVLRRLAAVSKPVPQFVRPPQSENHSARSG